MARSRPVDPATDRTAATVVSEAAKLAQACADLVEAHARAVGAVRTALDGLAAEAVSETLRRLPLAKLRDVTGGGLRINALEAAGYRTVADIHAASRSQLERITGVGPTTARQAKAAAHQLAKSAAEVERPQLRADQRTPAAAALLAALKPFVDGGPGLDRLLTRAEPSAAELTALLPAAFQATRCLRMLFSGRQRRDAAQQAVAGLDHLVAKAPAHPDLAWAVEQLRRPAAQAPALWRDFQTRAAEYHTYLQRLTGQAATAEELAAHEGHLPGDLASQVRSHPLDDSALRVTLRGYQAFGARFALARQRAILGDEMGLGKTIQALAAIAHLHATTESRYFLVVCPASVIVNWCREITDRTALRAHRLHGADREDALHAWLTEGGVAVTNYEQLKTLDVTDALALGMLVADEAHYVKNPSAQRSKAVSEWAERTERVLFLTGTVMENRLEEFQNLVGYLQPGLLPSLDGGGPHASPAAFRRAVAPVYLRRNQADVLNELPDLIETTEWEAFSSADHAAYVAAVAAGNFQAMRRAAYAVPDESAKLHRIVELARDAAESGDKVVVFSFFRSVLTTLQETLTQAGHPVHGPLTGNTSPAARQQLVDDFTTAPGHAILLSQIQAGGTGLNVQAANVVILTEPQVKPALEHQAIARAHRMGQTRRVRVHRILTPDGIDQRMLTLLATKDALFDSYARRSHLAETTAEAVDISETGLAQRIIAEERSRLAVDLAK